MSVLHERAVVKKEELYKVVGNDEYSINNFLDDKYEPRPIEDILHDAHHYLRQELRYSVFSGNCEHFVTKLRYGEPQSHQVQNAVVAAGTVGLGLGIVAFANIIAKSFGSTDKEKQTQ